MIKAKKLPYGQLTTLEVKNRIRDILVANGMKKDEFILIGKYTKKLEPITIKHKKCKREFDIKPGTFYNVQKCPYCDLERKDKEFKKIAKARNFTVTGKFRRTNIKISIRHDECGHEYEVKPALFKIGSGCPKCSYKDRQDVKSITKKQFKKIIKEKSGKYYSLISDFVDVYENVEMRHNTCGLKYPVTPYNFIRGVRCKNCHSKSKKTQEQFKKDLFDKWGNEYKIIGEYTGVLNKIKLKHSCGSSFYITPNCILRNGKCVKCKTLGVVERDDYIRLQFNNMYGGIFPDKEKCALAHDFLVKLTGSKQRLNFPDFNGIYPEMSLDIFKNEKFIKKIKKSRTIKERFIGVSFDKERREWKCEVKRKGIPKYQEYFPEEIDAVLERIKFLERNNIKNFFVLKDDIVKFHLRKKEEKIKQEDKKIKQALKEKIRIEEKEKRLKLREEKKIERKKEKERLKQKEKRKRLKLKEKKRIKREKEKERVKQEKKEERLRLREEKKIERKKEKERVKQEKKEERLRLKEEKKKDKEREKEVAKQGKQEAKVLNQEINSMEDGLINKLNKLSELRKKMENIAL